MANLTVSIDKEVLRKARIRALEQSTSVNALLRSYLEAFVGGTDSRTRAIRDVFALADRNPSRRGSRQWNREELHER